MFEWADRYQATRDRFIPWIEQTKSLAGCNVVEFGCGTGSVGLALATRAHSVFAIDIEKGSVSFAKGKQRELGTNNIEFHAASPEAIHAHVRRHCEKLGAGADVFVLFAVLEHMTTQERIDVLRLAKSVLKDDGVVVVCESPNRLTWGDHHTSNMPFNLQLPADVAMRSFHKSPRPFYVESMNKAKDWGSDALQESLVRLGRGLSFHEFVLAQGDDGSTSWATGLSDIVAANFDPLLLPTRHVQRDELHLWRFLDANAAKLGGLVPPCFARYYIDCILTKHPTTAPRRMVVPWVWDTIASQGVAYSRWNLLHFQSDDSVLVCNFSGDTSRIVLGVEGFPNALSIGVTDDSGGACQVDVAAGTGVPTRYLDVPLARSTRSVRIRGVKGMTISFVGYERTY